MIPTENLPLSNDEIRSLLLVIDQNTIAKAQLQMAQELEIAMVEQMRRKRGLGTEWVILDILDGFVHMAQARTE